MIREMGRVRRRGKWARQVGIGKSREKLVLRKRHSAVVCSGRNKKPESRLRMIRCALRAET